ncbi:glycosyltransferase family 2 protein [Butyrivibrio sp. VCD2006]|uniref:glycosyltransferase family 2 protein n=1 Tax=Butyrivibrio sp. VCD2006 TaxID=1280664 RepID=UPI00041B22CB|nr:glycosyltransferase family 2 protein [Butyrivibrio sp. VCD2006]
MEKDRRLGNRISIVVPVYNAGNFILETIEMVRQQTYENFELILVDDASTDNSVELIEKAAKDDNRIKLIKKASNTGAAAARNAGISAATGRYLAFLDADDIWIKDKLEKELAFLQEKKAAFVFTAYEFGDENANPTGRVVYVPETLTFKQALSRTVIFTSTVMIDMDVVPKDKIFMPGIESEDTATWWNILKGGTIAYGLDEVLAIYRRPGKSLSSNKFSAIRRIWGLYRKIAGLSRIASLFYFVGWAFRATVRRL